MRPCALLIILLIFSAVQAGDDAGSGGEFPVYVGRAVCLECHASGHDAGSCAVHPIPEHAKSYEALSKPEARHIAALSGIFVPPTTSRICLDCHATAADEGPRWTAETFAIQDGVQCEACHGAGSLHVDVYRSQPPARQERPGATLERSEPWQWCAPCHVEKPSHREVLEFGFELSVADPKYKTPVNLAVSPDGTRLYVACEHGDSLSVIDAARGEVIGEIDVGRRPQDVAVSPDGLSVYVTNRASDTVSVIDAVGRKVLRNIPVGRDPHGVLTDQSGRRLLVLNTGEDTVSVIDAGSGKEINRLAAGGGPWSMALRPDGQSCLITSVRPSPVRFRDPCESELTVIDMAEGVVASRPIAPEANMLQGIATVPGRDVTLFTLVRTKNLVPTTRLAQGWTITNGLGIVWGDDRIDQVLLDAPAAYFPDPMDVAVSPDGRVALVTSGGADQVAVIDIGKLLETVAGLSDHERETVLPNHLGMSSRFVIKRLPVGANPRGVTYSPDGRYAYVACALDDAVTVIETSDYSVARVIKLGGPDQVSEIRWGERLFHSADIAFGRQFSCHSCHPDGHINGLTFDIEADRIGRFPVDNRTLRGILDTPPFKWEGINPSLARQCGPRLAVFFTRLAPYTPVELQALVRYMCTIEQSPNPYRLPDGLTLAQRRGKAVFDRTRDNHGNLLSFDRQCAYCHSGAYKTNRRVADVGSTMWFDSPTAIEPDDLFDANEFGALGSYYYIDAGLKTAAFDVAHLRNVYESAPYLHNGGAATLEEIWTRFNMIDRHGMTGDLTREQFNDLIAYLKSL